MTASARPFQVKSDVQGILALLRDWGGILLLAAVQHALLPRWTLPLTWIGIAHLQFAIGEALVHEASHHQLFATRKLNTWVAPLVCWPFGFTMRDYRAEHMHHHRALNQPTDHLSQAYDRYGIRPLGTPAPDAPVGWRQALWIWIGRPLTGLAMLSYVRDVVSLAREPGREGVAMALAWTVVAGASWATGTLGLLVLYWIVPLLTGFSALYYWSEVGDHYVVPVGDSRTRTAPLSNWLHHHNGLHALHHRHAAIPFHQLPRAYAALRGTFPETVSRGWLDTLQQIAVGPGEGSGVGQPGHARELL